MAPLFCMSGMVLSKQDASSCMCRADRKHSPVARVSQAIWNLEEAISKLEVSTNRNPTQGWIEQGNRAMDWDRPNINCNLMQ
jgi:hypothetical protein